jgi:hypothetical protein
MPRKMFRKTAFALLGLLTAFNILALAVNFALPSHAAVAGMDHDKRARDPDFVRAVQSVVQGCRVNVDLAKLQC